MEIEMIELGKISELTKGSIGICLENNGTFFIC